MSKQFLISILFLTPTMGLADDAALIRGPVAGFIHDRSTHAIRPVLGVPGSAYLGDALLSNADTGSVSPDGSIGLAVLAGRLQTTSGLKTASPEWIAVENGIADVDLFAWSQSAAAVYSSKSGHVQIIRDLDKSPVASAEFDLSALPGSVAALALDGDAVLVGVAGGVYLVKKDASPLLLASAQNPVALAIAGKDLYFADRDGGSIWHVPSFRRRNAPVAFSGGIDGLVGVSIVETTTGTRLVAASAGGKQLHVYDLLTRAELATLDLEFSPETVEPMGARGQLLLARGIAGEQPYYVLDISREPAVYFVPAGRDQ